MDDINWSPSYSIELEVSQLAKVRSVAQKTKVIS